jgi:hypothetical protein
MEMILGLRGSFWRKAIFAGALVALADVLLFNSGGGSVLGLFTGAWALFSFAAHKSGWNKPWSLAGFAFATGFAGMLVYDPSLLATALFLASLGIAIMLPQIEGAADGWYWGKRLLFHGLTAPFNPVIDLLRMIRARRRKSSRLAVSKILPVLVLPVIGTALFLSLFAMANPLISDFLAQIQMGDLNGPDIARLFFWGFIFILVWSTLRPWRAKAVFSQLGDSAPGRIAGVSIASVTLSLILFNLLFALQNGLDLAYLWGDIVLPAQFTLAEYAHRGAYPLVATALLAGLFIIFTTHPKSELAGNAAIRWLVIVWIAQNLLLLASTVERTLLYVDAYSLTRLRIAALLWMGLVGVGLVLVTWRMLRGRSLAWLVNGNLLAAFAVLTSCTYVDLGEIAASWNVRHAREVGGRGVHLDLCYLNNLNASALPALTSLEQRPGLPPAFKQRVTLVRQSVQQRIEKRQKAKGGWRWRDARRLADVRRLGLSDLKIPKGYHVSCNGELYVIGERYEEDSSYDRY